ncbi:histidine kinase [Cohnella sp.]|uniref:histidine kinase n=1 Tax=Cohnella sp. TaxID=1883426 RepID=UPI003569C7AC
MADYLRGSFSFSNIQKEVPFSCELALIRSYVEIEQVRFDNVRVEYVDWLLDLSKRGRSLGEC